jgi:outer membrane protein OmpA-like peptidoglycan-associated protein
MLKKMMFIVALLLLAINAKSEETDGKFSYGLFGGYLINMHSADFKAIPDCPSCSPGYESGSGGGLGFGALFEYKLAPKLSLGARVEYNDISALLKREEGTKVLIEGDPVDGIFEHTIDAILSTAGIEPMVRYEVFNNFRVSLGLYAGILLNKDYAQKEEITEPVGVGTFLNPDGTDSESRTRNESSGTLSKPASLLLAPAVGLSYSLPMNASHSLTLEPEVFYYMGLSNIVNDPLVTKWKASSIRLGLAVIYTPPKEKVYIRKSEKIRKIDTIEVKKDLLAKSYISKGIDKSRIEESTEGNIILTTEIVSRVDTLFIERKYELSADITAVGVDADGKEVKNPKVIVEEFTSFKVKPLLNYIFFEDNSSALPVKYQTLNKSQAEKFQVNDLYSYETMEIYYNSLNVIGKRMTDNPKAKLKIVGCNSDFGNEKGNKELSTKRATIVKDYLVNIWIIKDTRLTVEGRNLPEKASTPATDAEKSEENRRVEIYTDDYEILAPVFLADTIRTSNPPIVRFYPTVKSDAGVTSWKITANQDIDNIQNSFVKEGNTTPSSTIDWEVAKNNSLTPKKPLPINYTIKVKDQAGKEFETPVKTLPFELVTIVRKREMGIQDKKIENFSLILFDFDKSVISGTNKKIVDMIKNRITPESIISIEGYTDRIGEDEYNMNLSEKRALTAKDAIGRKDAKVVGVGEGKLLYDNNIPEGRFYCRTVDIRIETPIKK